MGNVWVQVSYHHTFPTISLQALRILSAKGIKTRQGILTNFRCFAERLSSDLLAVFPVELPIWELLHDDGATCWDPIKF
jgi:hypothetical protein